MSGNISKIIKKISNKNISVKKNYKLLRVIQKIINPDFFNKDDFQDIVFSLDDRDVKCRVFDPSKELKVKKIIIFIHGGGWVYGCINSYTKTCVELSKKTNRIVIAIDYRLAPEYPYPAGFNDCYEIVNMIMNGLDELGISRKDVCLMGDSAGGNLAAAISLKARATKDFKVGSQILLYPALQMDYSDTTKYKSVIDNGKDYLLTQKQLQEYIEMYVTDIKDLNSPYVSPLKAKLPLFQPKTLIITCDNDPLRDEGKSYARKLKLFLNKVTYYNFEGALHAFLTMPIGKEHKEKAYLKINEFLGDENE